MIRKNLIFHRRMTALLDGLLVLGAYCLSVWLWLELFRHDRVNVALLRGGFPHMLLIAAVYALFTVLLLALAGVYDLYGRRLHSLLPRVWGAGALGILCGMAALYLLRQAEFSRGVLGLFFLLSCSLVSLRLAVGRYFLLRAGQRQVLVVGSGALAEEYARAIAAEPEAGIRVIGFLSDGARRGADLGGLDRLPSMLSQGGVDEVVAALEPEEVYRIREIIRACEQSGTRISVIPFYNDLIPASAEVEAIGTCRVINLRANPLDNAGLALLKRLFDIAASALLLVLLSPLLCLCALGVRLSSPGPVLFAQTRVGRGKKPFTMYKFRSMRAGAGAAWTTEADPRRTGFGALMRKFSLDELPQLWNVLRGDMSLVGPRPEIPLYVERFKESVPLYMVKHQVRPGMTGWAQVNGWRGDTDIPTRIRFDVWYIEHWSIRLDLLILLRTLLGGFVNREKVKDR